MKRTIGAIALILAIVGAVGALGWLSGGFRNWDTGTWLTDETETDSQVLAVDENGNAITSGGSYIMPRQMTFMTSAATVNDTVTLTASVYPATAEYKVVDWAVSWVNPSSAWANGKAVTDYVTVNPTADGALTANVSCLQAFGEKATIRVNLRGADNIYSTCAVDFKSRFTCSTTINGNNFANNQVIDYPTYETPLAVNINSSVTVGTAVGEEVSTGYCVRIDTYIDFDYIFDNLRTQITAAGLNYNDYKALTAYYERKTLFDTSNLTVDESVNYEYTSTGILSEFLQSGLGLNAIGYAALMANFFSTVDPVAFNSLARGFLVFWVRTFDSNYVSLSDNVYYYYMDTTNIAKTTLSMNSPAISF